MMSSGPHPQVPLTQAQIAQQQQAQAHASELAKRRSRKPTDKNIPEGVEDSIVNPDAVQRYKDLRDVERRLDAIMTRKRLDIVDSASRTSKVCQYSIFASYSTHPATAQQDSPCMDQQHSRGSNLARKRPQR